MSKKNISITDLNDCLCKFLKSLKETGASTKGHKFDETIQEKLKNFFKQKGLPAKFISNEQWSDKNKNSIFYEHKNLSLKNIFNFTSLSPVVYNNEELNLMIVDKPNGSQKWPDALVIFNGIGFPIEVKSSNDDGIIWNSGIPKPDTLYIYNCYGKSKTTFFLGQHAITNDELNFIKKCALEAKQFNLTETSNRWRFYVRNMFNSNQTFFENNKLLEKIEKLELKKEKYINKNQDELVQKIDDEIQSLKQKYQFELDKRLNQEQDTIDKISNLKWDSSQLTDFSEDI